MSDLIRVKPTSIAAAALLLAATAAFSQQLLVNGDFAQGLYGWTPHVGGPCGTRTVSLVSSDGDYSNVVELASVDGYGCGGGSQVYQEFQLPVANYSALILSGDVKAISADVGDGCGWLGQEYPIHLDVYYTDPGGSLRFYSLRFILAGVPADTPFPSPG